MSGKYKTLVIEKLEREIERNRENWSNEYGWILNESGENLKIPLAILQKKR